MSCLGCTVLLYFVVCMTLLAYFFLPSASLINILFPHVCTCKCVVSVHHAGSNNEEFSFRHDWNSLISDDPTLQMKYYSEDYFPPADVYVGCHITTVCLLFTFFTPLP